VYILTSTSIDIDLKTHAPETPLLYRLAFIWVWSLDCPLILVLGWYIWLAFALDRRHFTALSLSLRGSAR
jgi:hypothetical protein